MPGRHACSPTPWKRFAIAVLCTILVSFQPGCTREYAGRQKVGAAFPELGMRSLDGRIVSTRNYAGQALLINVWATWCPPCRRELPGLQKLSLAMRADQLRVLGLAVDDDDTLVRELLFELGVAFPNYLDPGGKSAIDVLDVRSYPRTYLIGRKGMLLAEIVGARDWDSPEMLAWMRQQLQGDAIEIGTPASIRY
jgi:thiol-disulfide isomerase/thioredoxin